MPFLFVNIINLGASSGCYSIAQQKERNERETRKKRGKRERKERNERKKEKKIDREETKVTERYSTIFDGQ
jgi:hypothetical protein